MNRRLEGSGLIIVLFSITIFSVLVGVTFVVTTNHARLANRTADRAAAIAHADGVVEDLYDQWRQEMISVTDETDRKNGVTNQRLKDRLVSPPGHRLPARRGVALQEWRVESATPLLTERKGNSDRPVPFPEYSFNRKIVNAKAPRLANRFLKAVFRKISSTFKLKDFRNGDGSTKFNNPHAADQNGIMAQPRKKAIAFDQSENTGKQLIPAFIRSLCRSHYFYNFIASIRFRQRLGTNLCHLCPRDTPIKQCICR